MIVVTAALAALATMAPEPESRWWVHGSIGGARFTESEWHVAPALGAAWISSPRLQLGPELSYLYASEADQDLVLLSRFFYDLGEPERAFAPYLTGGVGILWHRELVGFGPEGPPGVRPYWSSELWAGGGVGVRLPISRKLDLAPELQAAWPLVIHLAVRFRLPI